MPANMALPHQFNNTNFHFHGAHCSPSGIADNVMRSMVPGKKYDIEITLPKDRTQGTYWYHPHHHGGADVQMASGMSGAIIVEGDFARRSGDYRRTGARDAHVAGRVRRASA